jgi:hypothetical protein
MKQLTALVLAIGFVPLFQFQTIAGEHSAFARVTVYWHEGSGANASWSGARLNEGHCAVNPKKFLMAAKLSFMMRSVWL